MKFVRQICIYSETVFPHGYELRGWLYCVKLRSLALTRKSLRLLLRLKLQWVYSNGGDELRMCKCLRIMD